MSKLQIFLLSSIIFVLLLIGGAFFAEYKIKSKIEEGFADLPGAEYEKVSVSLWNGKINLQNVKLNTPLESVAEAGRGKKVVGTIDRAYIDGLHWLDLATDNELLASEIGLKNPQLKFYTTAVDSVQIPEASPQQKDETQAFFAQIKSLDLDEGNIEFYGEGEKNPRIRLQRFAFSFSDFTFDAALENDKIKFAEYNLEADSFFMAIEDKLHHLNIEKVRTENNHLIMKNLRFDSPLGKDAFMQKLEWRKAMIDLTVPEMILHNFAPQKFLKQQYILPLLEVKNAELTVSVDQKVPKNPEDYKILPTEALRKIKGLLHIDSVAVSNTKVTFALKTAKRENYGTIYWTDIDAGFSNITNDSIAFRKNSDLIARTRSRFMGTSRLDLTVRFKLNSPTFGYDFSGRLDTFDMRQTNQMFADISSLDVVSGSVKELSFDVRADDNRSTGDLLFSYKNLEVHVLDKDGKRERKVLNWLISKILIDQKTAEDMQAKKGEIDVPRDKKRGIFNQMWISVLDGLKEVILP